LTAIKRIFSSKTLEELPRMSTPKICLNKGKLFLFRAGLFLSIQERKRVRNNKQISGKENFDADTIS